MILLLLRRLLAAWISPCERILSQSAGTDEGSPTNSVAHGPSLPVPGHDNTEPGSEHFRYGEELKSGQRRRLQETHPSPVPGITRPPAGWFHPDEMGRAGGSAHYFQLSLSELHPFALLVPA